MFEICKNGNPKAMTLIIIRRQAMERNSGWNINKAAYRTVIRGDLFYADLSPVKGSEQGGIRPVLVIQNDTGNRHSPTVIVAAITSRTIDRSRLKEYIGHLDRRQMGGVDRAMAASLGLEWYFRSGHDMANSYNPVGMI